VHPSTIASLVPQYQAEAQALAYNRRLARLARGPARLVKMKIPSRLPRYWRWRYLGTRAAFRRRTGLYEPQGSAAAEHRVRSS
jgi:hypothetical protein